MTLLKLFDFTEEKYIVICNLCYSKILINREFWYMLLYVCTIDGTIGTFVQQERDTFIVDGPQASVMRKKVPTNPKPGTILYATSDQLVEQLCDRILV